MNTLILTIEALHSHYHYLQLFAPFASSWTEIGTQNLIHDQPTEMEVRRAEMVSKASQFAEQKHRIHFQGRPTYNCMDSDQRFRSYRARKSHENINTRRFQCSPRVTELFRWEKTPKIIESNL